MPCQPARRCSLAGAAEQSALQARVRRVGAEPDGEKGCCEVIAGDRALHRAVHLHLEARARLVDVWPSTQKRASLPLQKIFLYFGGFTTIYVTWLPCVAG